jgi:predicted NUDIX family NTP pyrophosphohydrolase
MAKQSAGLLVYRKRDRNLEVFLVHPGGPIWQNKDAGAWSIPKGEFTTGEDPLDAAKREFQEETGMTIDGVFTALEPITQRSGKTVYAWLVEGEVDASQLKSNTFSMEWPPRSGNMQEFPEVDLGEWFDVETAREKINDRQRAFLEQLQSIIL